MVVEGGQMWYEWEGGVHATPERPSAQIFNHPGGEGDEQNFFTTF